ncbi:hypothetical protein [Shewanella glacialipiscicola]|uniref:Uncharacterized protein n=1 Tax=Shewanella glacialipiscicola TaxID=614069 RepID=A0ABQ6J1H6_9GAMM|nr:hypothetical protein [Shewanella glacialipiscicola]MCL1086034.1 hypothetical protein [Shewanella glacialipiscicola]MCU7993716.1 hypothetical protein [Shewanella glacialipiscicola]MCU8025034.1 hypothetical protein [Shewanella glacialipiscicola]GIU07978.1 hypothetical protein TUM4636_12070 [Shewanella glacialipiscicola]GMA80792.1 hypothetical protein GCM10025855_03250 [Shewanella glacialipiscicola]
MKNMTLRVNIEGKEEKVATDWYAIMATLKDRGVDYGSLQRIYAELNAGLLVTTRSLTLAKVNAEMVLAGVIREMNMPASYSMGRR